MTMKFDLVRVNYLAGRLASVAISHDRRELGRLALEILILRNNAEDVLEGKYSAKDKREAKMVLKTLRELEKKVAYLYASTLFRRESGLPSHQFVKKSIFGKVKMR